jgi:hypothetical protein
MLRFFFKGTINSVLKKVKEGFKQFNIYHSIKGLMSSKY